MTWRLLSERVTRWLESHRVTWLVMEGQVRSDRERRVTMTVGPSAPAVIVGPSDSAPSDEPTCPRRSIVIIPSVPTWIAPPKRPAWDEQGWREVVNGTQTFYEGHYRVRQRNGRLAEFPGRILVGDNITTYIAHPPPAIKRHPKGPCFQLTTPPWFRVHWHRAPSNVDDALLYVETVLDEVLN